MKRGVAAARLKTASGPLLIVVIAIVTMVAFHRGIVVRDARFEHIVSPWQFVTRHLQLWDDSRGPGVPLQYFSPVVGVVQSFFAWIGMPAWLIGRLTLSMYLSTAGIGAWYLWRKLWPERSAWAILAGLLYAFNPYSVQAIMPSGLFLPVALLPWLIAFTYEGVRAATNSQWHRTLKFAAASAIAVFSVGMLNTASLLFVLVPVAIFGALLILEGSASWRGLFRFGVPAAVLTALVSAPMLLVLALSSPVVARNLGTTELPETIAQTSSSFESWRGLGKWLSYYGWGKNIETASASVYLNRPIVIVATFVALALALVALGWKRTPLRRAWGILLIGSILVMVGAHSPHASPIGRAFEWVFDHVGGATAFRTTYKGGPIAVLAISILATCGLLAVLSWFNLRFEGSKQRRFVLVGTVVVVASAFLVSASPLLVGSRLGDQASVADIPDYWKDTFTWFESVPQTDRVLVLPATSRAKYQWGWINDTLFEAFMHPMVLTASTVPSTTEELADATMFFDRLISDYRIDPSAVTPILKWLGVRWVLVQNDLDPIETGIPPDPVAELRSAPGLSLAAQFGRDANGYSMVDVFSVDQPTPDATYSSGPPLIVSGGPDSLYSLAANGLLTGRPTTFLPDLGETQTSSLLTQGAPVVVTDGSRRVASSALGGSRIGASPLMTVDETSIRPILVLNPDDPSTQTVAEFADASRITANRTGNSFDSWSIDTSAAAAFDEDAATSWWVNSGVGTAVGSEVTVDLKVPTFVDRVVVTQAMFGDAHISRAQVEVTGPSGETSSFPFTFDGSKGQVSIGEQATSIALRIEETNDVLGRFGFQDVQVFGTAQPLDLVQWQRVPTDIEQLKMSSPATYAFARSESEVENSLLRRTFVVPAKSEFRVTSTLSMTQVADSSSLDRTCRPWFTLDDAAVNARITSYDATTKSGILESCEPVVMSAGTHRLTAIGTPTAQFVSVRLSPVEPLQTTTIIPVESQRVSASEHTVSIPSDPGWLSVLIPAHKGWTLSAHGRSTDVLVMNGEMGWSVDAGEAVTATVRFGPQVIYRIAMVLSVLTLLFCLALVVWRRRERS